VLGEREKDGFFFWANWALFSGRAGRFFRLLHGNRWFLGELGELGELLFGAHDGSLGGDGLETGFDGLDRAL